jgi:putative heme-binding domain-containing protein
VLRIHALLSCSFISATFLAAQDVNSGKAIFRSNCAFCHGVTGVGGRGPSLVTAKTTQNTSDADLRTIIQKGVAGTQMPAFDNITGDDLNHLVDHIRSLAASGVVSAPVSGNAKHGAELYAKSGCANCHRIGNSGGDYGPSLTRIGGARSSEYIKQSLLDPSSEIPQEYEGVTVVTAAGKKVTGARVNEDSFSVQLRLPDSSFGLFKKSDLKSVTYETKSLMPAYSKLPPGDLQDLLAYLDTLRGNTIATDDATKAKGIH